MTALIIILLLLGALTLTPIGARACYTGNVFYLDLRVGHIHKRLLPKKEKKKARKKPKKAKKKKEKKPKPEQEKTEKSKKKKRPISFYLRLGKEALHGLGIFIRSIVIDRLNVCVIFADPNPEKAALNYAKASSIVESAQGLLLRARRLKRYDIQLNVDFFAEKLDAQGEIEISFMLWTLFGMTSYIGFALIKMLLSEKRAQLREKRLQKKERTMMTKHGGYYERV